MAAEAPENQKYYSVPDDLKLLELRTRANLGKADTDFQAATEAFTTELDRRMAEINELKKKVEAISKADSLAELMKYDNLKVARNGVTVKTATSLKPGCCAWFMRLFHQTNSPAQPAMTVAPDAQKIEEIRARLLSEYDSEIKFRVGLYNDYGDNGPRKTDQYRSEWNAVKAKIIHDQIDFYRGQSKDVMLHCLRLYVLTIRTYFLVYGENPLAEEKTSGLAETGGVKKDFGDHEKPVLKAKELFRQMAKGMKSQLSLFYCLQPDRYGFMNYLENYNSIQSQQDRDAVLAGKATEEMLEKIFPQFEAPEEAFQLRSSH